MGVTDVLFLLAFVVAGGLPLVLRSLVSRRAATIVASAWLFVAGAYLLRPGANSPHSFGLFLFLVFLIGWLIAMYVIWTGSDRVKEI